MNKLIWLLMISMLAFGQNPAMDGFNSEKSDKKAIEIADQVMEKLGGYENWNNTRFISWNFFGYRMHYWDKWTGDYRMEFKNRVVVMNINSMEGQLYINGKEENSTDSLTKYIQFAKSAWINDSYWMFMPYKLKDSGVTLKYVGEGKMEDKTPAYILQLTFENVGDTPDNKYYIYVNKENYLVQQWDFFRKFEDTKPGFSRPWKNWKMYGKIMLSDNRGMRGHSHIAVFENFDEALFKSSTEIDFSKLK